MLYLTLVSSLSYSITSTGYLPLPGFVIFAAETGDLEICFRSDSGRSRIVSYRWGTIGRVSYRKPDVAAFWSKG